MPLKLLKGIRHFKNNQFKEKQDVFASLSKGQAPDVLFFGCIDSRIDLRLITNSNLGELLVARNPGNIVPPHSANPSGEAASSEFALTHLQVSEIIVCGHSHCGAMKGLMTSGLEKDLPDTANWLSHAKEALEHVHHHHPELNDEPSLKLKKLTQINILLQIKHLQTHPVVAQRLAEGKLKTHGWYYEFEKGEIYIYNSDKKDFISFEETVDEIALKKLQHIIQNEAKNYLNELTPIENTGYNVLLKQFSTPHSVVPIWNHIKLTVKRKAQEELGELYLTSNGDLSPRFEELLNKGSAIQVAYTNNKYQQISDVFCQTLNYKSMHLSEIENALLATVSQLQEHVLEQFSTHNKQFDFESCMLLARRTQVLTEKLINRTASTLDVEQFKQLYTSFENNNLPTLPILNIILASIVTIAASLIGGFLLTGLSGTVIGGAVASSTSAALMIGMWAQKKEPAIEFTCNAEKILQENEDNIKSGMLGRSLC